MIEGIDPERLMELHGIATNVAEFIDWQTISIRDNIENLDLTDLQGTVLSLCQEVIDELTNFAGVALIKSGQIEMVANDKGGTIVAGSYATGRLEASLDDGLGADGIDDPDEKQRYADELDQWLEDNPEFTGEELREKMEEAAARGDTDALITLSNALWRRIEGMDDEAAAEFLLVELGTEGLMVAAELTQIPATGPIVHALIEKSTYVAPAYFNTSIPLRDFLFQRQGVVVDDDSREWASDQLLKLSRRDEDVAELVLNEIDEAHIAGLISEENGGPLAAAMRKVAKEQPALVKERLEIPDKGQRLVDVISIGSEGTSESSQQVQAELNQIQASFVSWAENNRHLSNEERSQFTGAFYRYLAQVGHSYGYDWSALADVAAPVLDNLTKGIASALVALPGVIVPDEVEARREMESILVQDRRNAAFLVLTERNPEAAKVILDGLGLDEDTPPGQLTNDMWLGLEEVAEDHEPDEAIHQAKAALAEIEAEMAPVWGLGQR